MLTRLYQSKKHNTEKTNKDLCSNWGIKLGVINFRDCSYSLAYLHNKLALNRILRELTKKPILKLNPFSEKLSDIKLSHTMKGK